MTETLACLRYLITTKTRGYGAVDGFADESQSERA